MSYYVTEQIKYLIRVELDLLESSSITLLGGTGLIGRWILEAIRLSDSRRALKVLVTGRSRPSWLEGRYGSVLVEFVPCDFSGPVTSSFIEKAASGLVISLVAPRAEDTYSGMQGADKLVIAANLSIALNLLARDPRVLDIVYASSGVAVRPADRGLYSEMESGGPDLFGDSESLAHSKRLVERMCYEISSAGFCNSKIARIFSCFGPHIPSGIHYAIGEFIYQALDKGKIVVRSNGLSRRSYAYCLDLVISIFRIVNVKKVPDRFDVWNIGGECYEIKEVANIVGRVCGLSSNDIEVLGESDYSVGNSVRKEYIPCLQKAKKDGIYSELVSFEKGLRAYIGAL